MDSRDRSALEDMLRGLQGISRRGFLKLSASFMALAALPVGAFTSMTGSRASNGRVIRTHHQNATSWNFATGWYGNQVDQAIVDAMVDRGMLELTGAGSVQAAWSQIIPGYIPGQKIAIKVNLNNCSSCYDTDNTIDALIEVVNAVVRGLMLIGAAPADIWVFDAVRTIPNRFLGGNMHPGVLFWDATGSCGNSNANFSSGNPDAYVQWGRTGLPSQKITDVLINADYLINIPIMKNHVGAGVTVTFKNHFGTINSCAALHPWSWMSGSQYVSTHNPLVDIYLNPHIVGKNVLVLGDGLFASKTNQPGSPLPWSTFGNSSPNVLFFSQDPVAIDCVMYDHLAAETSLYNLSDDYLVLAAEHGLGVFDHASGGSYSEIDYRSFDLGVPGAATPYGASKAGSAGVAPSIAGSGPFTTGSQPSIDVTGGLGGAEGALVLAEATGNLTTSWGTLLVSQILTVMPLTLGGSPGVAGAGSTSIAVPIPADVRLVGREFFLQAAIADPGAPQGISHTQRLKATIGL